MSNLTFTVDAQDEQTAFLTDHTGDDVIVIRVAENDGKGLTPARFQEYLNMIAAAPDMLKALKDCVVEDGAACWESEERMRRMLRAITITARSAIAKAEGHA